MIKPDLKAIMAEREVLFAQMAGPNDVKPTWVRMRRTGSRIRTKVLRQIIAHVEGAFYMSQKRICFESDKDALVYKLMFPGSTHR